MLEFLPKRGRSRRSRAVAAKQHGNITRSQLLDLGVDDKAIAYRVKVGRLHRVFRGVYSVGRRPVTPQEWASAAVLACGAGAALSHGSAMALWGYWRQWDKPYEVTVVGDRRTKGIRVHRSTTLRRRDVTKQLGIRVTTPARTLSICLPAERQGAQAHGQQRAALAVADPGSVRRRAGAPPRAPAAKRIARLIGLPGTPTRSGWEDDFPVFCAVLRVAGAGHGRAAPRLHRRRAVRGEGSHRRARQPGVPHGQDRVRERSRPRRGHAGARLRDRPRHRGAARRAAARGGGPAARDPRAARRAAHAPNAA